MGTLAWRNVWRKRGRSLFTIAVVALVVVLSLVYFAFGGAAQNAIYGSLTDATGHLQVRVDGYRDLREFGDLLIRDADSVGAALEAESGNGGVARVLEVSGLLEGNERSRGVSLVGIDRPEALRAEFEAESLAAGRLPQAGEVEALALSEGLARALGVALGDTVYAYAPGTEGYGAAAYTVVGLLDVLGTGHTAHLSLAAAQELAAPDAVTRFEVHMADLNRLDQDEAVTELRDRVEGALGDGYAVEAWRDLNAGMAAYLDMLVPMQTIVNGIFFVLAGLLVTNTIYLSVIERVREFGIIQALGARGRRVMGMVLSESLVLCGLGALVGTGVGLAIVARMAQGIHFGGDMGEYLAGFGFPPVLYASLAPSQLVITLAFTLAIGILAALLPALTATRMEPIEAIRFTA